MSVAEIIRELSKLTFEQRQLLIRRALELDDLPLSDADVSLAESRLAQILREELRISPAQLSSSRLADTRAAAQQIPQAGDEIARGVFSREGRRQQDWL